MIQADDELDALIVANVERLRTERDMSLADLGKAVGCTKHYVWNLLDRRTCWSVKNLQRFAAALRVDPAELLSSEKK